MEHAQQEDIGAIRLNNLCDYLKDYLVKYIKRPERFMLGHLKGFQTKRTSEARIPSICRHYAKHGHIEAVKWLYDTYEPFCRSVQHTTSDIVVATPVGKKKWRSRARWDIDSYAARGAAEGGHINILDWLANRGCRFDGHVLHAAACNGRMDVLAWTKEIQPPWGYDVLGSFRDAEWGKEDRLTWLSSSSEDGALHIEVPAKMIRYIHFADGLEADLARERHNAEFLWCLGNGCFLGQSVAHSAATAGNIEVLAWAMDNGLPMGKFVCKKAAEKGHLDLLKFAICHGYALGGDVCTAAALGGHLELLKWALENGCEPNAGICSSAALAGHLGVLKWATENLSGWDDMVCPNAALGGHLEVLQFAKENGHIFDIRVCFSAAEGGHLHVLKWARHVGCEWNANVCAYAALGGHLEVLKWARQNGCEWKKNVVRVAVDRRRFDILKWIKQNGGNFDSEVCRYMTRRNLLSMLQWARQEGFAWDKRTCYEAVRLRRLAILDWVVDNGCPFDLSELTRHCHQSDTDHRIIAGPDWHNLADRVSSEQRFLRVPLIQNQ